LKFYSHFTSPIRRYPDLQIHRILKEIISDKFSLTRKEHYQEILPKIAQRSSDTADRAEKMEYRVRDMLACKYMKDKIGEAFTVNISGMIEK
jgi:ribonuclease R